MSTSKYPNACEWCQCPIGPEYGNELYRLSFKTFCSIVCFGDYYKDKENTPKKKKVKKK